MMTARRPANDDRLRWAAHCRVRWDWWAAALSTLHLHLSSLLGLVAAALAFQLARQTQARHSSGDRAKQIDTAAPCRGLGHSRGSGPARDTSARGTGWLGSGWLGYAWLGSGWLGSDRFDGSRRRGSGSSVSEAVGLAAACAALAAARPWMCSLPGVRADCGAGVMTVHAAALLSIFAQGFAELLVHALGFMGAAAVILTPKR